MRRLALLVVPLAFAGCGSSTKTESTAPPPTATQAPPAATTTDEMTTSAAIPPAHPATGKVKVAIDAPTHTPSANTPWEYSVHVTSEGKPVSARIYIQVLFNNTSVVSVGSHLVEHGVWTETITWPKSLAGRKLVFSVRAISSGRLGEARYPIRVK